MITSFRTSIATQKPSYNRLTVPVPAVVSAVPPHTRGVLNTWLQQYAPRGMK